MINTWPTKELTTKPMPTLYLMMGYPGAGKTTTARLLHDLTGAEHLWADEVRKRHNPTPSHSSQESQRLYDHLNQRTQELLLQGKSVIFDTNFNYYKDRQKLRAIAKQANATTVLLWVQTPKELAKQRATASEPKHQSRVLGNMSEETFERLTDHLEPPQANEQPVIIDGSHVTRQNLHSALFNN